MWVLHLFSVLAQMKSFKQIEREETTIGELRLVEKTGKFAFFGSLFGLVGYRDVLCSDYGGVNKPGVSLCPGSLEGSVSQHDT